MRPNFVLVGAMKCGTTSLADQLAMHPQIFMSEPKEVHFFSWDKHWNRGVGWYESLFAEAAGKPAVGEGSTTYTMHPVAPNVPQRMAQVIPEAKLLYIVRHPVERIISHYLHMWYEGKAPDNFAETVERQQQFIDYSRYHFQIEQFLPFYPRQRWLILFFEQFVREPAAVHRQIYEFLGIDPAFSPPDVSARNVTENKIRRAKWVRGLLALPMVYSVAKAIIPPAVRSRLGQIGEKRGKPEVSNALYNRLLEQLRPDIEAFGRFVGRDLSEIWNLRPR